MRKTLPIGIDSFRKVRETDRYYVDKTLLIRDFIEAEDEVALIKGSRLVFILPLGAFYMGIIALQRF